MERNLDRRVEVLAPVRDPDLRVHLRSVVLDALLRDTDRAMALGADGHYERVQPAATELPFNAQQFLVEHYGQDEL